MNGCSAISNVSRAFQVTRIKVECSRDERFVQGGQSESNEVFDRTEATQRLSGCSRIRLVGGLAYLRARIAVYARNKDSAVEQLATSAHNPVPGGPGFGATYGDLKLNPVW